MPTGRKSRLRRRCTITPARPASIDTIFTVVTSPNSDKAKMWGHMPETTTAANGVVFKRPLLSAEIASGFTHGDNTENNETLGNRGF
ncbi:outer membrane protein RatB [Salmonella enterica subsp. enterica]|uniref:Outer membrane protein RatB n=1 Tax=Salmonella enterica I TaxID=59201 RepID=A0A447PBW8_SALET|nr:outer membrane protein RatB [Salmonella enterica subsp. enterica]